MKEHRHLIDNRSNEDSGNSSDISSAKDEHIRAWDLPTRLFKWSLVALIITAWISSGFDDPEMVVHKLVGYGILILIVFRVLWGFVGSTTARFSNFVRSPSIISNYLKALRRNRAEHYLGHNPVGGVMVIGLLLACGVQGLLGLFASDGVTAAGPFADAAGDTISSWAASVHATWFYIAIVGLACVHIATNLYYQLIKRDNLIGAMITGRKKRVSYVERDEARGGSLFAAAICLIVAAGLVFGTITLFGGTFFNAT
ncbi:cytochrome b/b6 domain-containing protein [Rhizobium sp. CNPSo 3968]|uniref:cytochrome b/b6 domain-containing protein n=1 Tax=Rhizobium sp. CNPSo 3968 TaxID=3021408 RepID=UPI00254BEA43|nr:cytochrome b/b6 domain-containing protein [Rhizobium sp. CNPSo 3968]MDK4722849.1 cytochrome b/b6 domain-containing protein [Rhizobium sp. CNPSo 3968]